MANHLIHPDFVGAYVYHIVVDRLVRYVGKGRRYRAAEHIRKAQSINRALARGEAVKATSAQKRLAQAMRDGAQVTYVVIANGLTDDEALDLEHREISSRPYGELWNVLPGGDSPSRDFLCSLWRRPGYREAMREKRTHYADPEFQERQRQRANAQFADPERRANWERSHRAIWDNPERAAERRDLLKKVWADPAKSSAKSALVRSQWTPERRASMSENRRRAWADPAFKARVAAKIKSTREKRKNDRPR